MIERENERDRKAELVPLSYFVTIYWLDVSVKTW